MPSEPSNPTNEGGMRSHNLKRSRDPPSLYDLRTLRQAKTTTDTQHGLASFIIKENKVYIAPALAWCEDMVMQSLVLGDRAMTRYVCFEILGQCLQGQSSTILAVLSLEKRLVRDSLSWLLHVNSL